MGSRGVVGAIVLAACCIAATSAADPYPVHEIAALPHASQLLGISFGDLDHDGWREVIFSSQNDGGQCCSFQVFEYGASDNYTRVHLGPAVYSLGSDDLDQDGKSEIIAQDGSVLQIYEAIDSTSFPTQLVWHTSVSTNNAGRIAFGDSDRDGHRELFFTNSSTIRIFESTGDNALQEFTIPTGAGGGIGAILVADLDLDGYIEVATTKSTAGIFRIYESYSNNSWTESFVTTIQYQPNRLVGGYDVDGNDKPDLFVGCHSDEWPGPFYFRTVVLETTGDNQFQQTDMFQVSDGFSGSPRIALGDLDGDGVEEFVLTSSNTFWVFRPFKFGEWTLIGEVTDKSAQSGAVVHDVNQNGRAEIFWEVFFSPWRTSVLEYTSGVADVLPVTGGKNRLTLFPNPFTVETAVYLPAHSVSAASVRIFDVRGRVVHDAPFAADAAGRGVLRAAHLTAGVYFVQIERADRTPLATGRAVIAPR